MIDSYRRLETITIEDKVTMRTAALKLAIGRVAEAMSYRGLCP